MANLSENTTIAGKQIKDLIAEMTYPLGSWYYNSEDNTNPSQLLGFGEWEPVSVGRVPVGFDPDDSDFDVVEKTGGEKEVTLSVDEMPSHDHPVDEDTTGNHKHDVSLFSALEYHIHSVPLGGTQSRASGSSSYDYWHDNGSGNTGDNDPDLNHSHTVSEATAGDHNHDVSVGKAGEGNSHNNLQPYITVYIWKRIG